jgi:hypothetical protein
VSKDHLTLLLGDSAQDDFNLKSMLVHQFPNPCALKDYKEKHGYAMDLGTVTIFKAYLISKKV